MKTTNPQTPSRNKATKNPDAIALLRADHKLVSGLFTEYGKTTSKSKKKRLVTQICKELSVHAQVEEDIFYPAVKRALKDKELIPEAIIEHETLKALIAQVEGVEPDGEMYDARINVLKEYVEHHVEEEHNEMFPKAKKTNLDMIELGGMITKCKADLLARRAE